ncbi:hypothetical protein R1sor_021412 [Riccia sorocarpa]|uniref:Uncharacterized protein n=1 Tax=Riccia sorocarpa TaxID=122646 RepID=A0ABD3GIF8_9MARC
MSPRPKMKVRKRGVSPPIDLKVDESFLDRIVDGFENVAMKRGDQDKEAAENQQQVKRACGIRSKRQPVSKDVAGPSGVVSGGAIVPHTAIPGAIVPFREPRGVSDAGQSGGPAVLVSAAEVEKSFKEMFGKSRMKDAFDTIKVWFNFKLDQPRNDGWFVEDFCRFSSENRPHGDILDKRTKFIIRHALKILGRQTLAYCSTRLAFLAMAHVDPQSPHLRPDWHEWLSAELKTKLLAYQKTDRGSQAKFREGWTAIVEIMKSNFLSAEAQAGSTDSTPLLLEACSSFGDFQAKWDAEKGQLVRETEKLKTELTKAQGEAEKSRMETVALKEEFSRQQKEWEENSQKLTTEIAKLHEEKQRIAGNEENVQRQLADIRQMLQETVTKASSVGAPEASNQVLQLQQQLQVKEQELVSIKSAEEKVLKRLKTAKKNVTKLETALKDMPSGVMVRSNVEAARRLKSGAKLEISQYPLVYVVAESYNVKAKEKSVICTFCRGSYHQDWTFGFRCVATHTTEINVESLQERLAAAEDTRTMDASKLGFDDGDMEVTGVLAMQVKKKELLSELKRRMKEVTGKWLDTFLKAGWSYKMNPPLRPWDGICLEFFAQPLLALPWAAKCLHDLVSKGVVSIWRSGHVPIEVLQNQVNYSSEDAFKTLTPFWQSSKVWSHEDRSHEGTSNEAPTAKPAEDEDEDDEDFICHRIPRLPASVDSWLISRI